MTLQPLRHRGMRPRDLLHEPIQCAPEALASRLVETVAMVYMFIGVVNMDDQQKWQP